MLDEKVWPTAHEFFHTKLAYPCLYEPYFVHCEQVFPKLFLQHWEHEIVQNILLCFVLRH